MNRILPFLCLLIALMSGCASRQHASKPPQNLQVGVRDKYLFAAMQPKPELRTPHSALRTPTGQTMSVAWSGDVFAGFRVWTSTDLQSWSVAAEGMRPISGFDFTNAVPLAGDQTFTKLELWR